MSILAFRRVMAVGAVIAAIAGISASRPAAAITFIFNAVCNDPGTCNPINDPAGVGVGTLITGTLALSQTTAIVGDLIIASDILSFGLTFTPGAPSFQSNSPFSYVFPFSPGFIIGSDPIGVFGGSGSMLTILNIDFKDSLDNTFAYLGSETPGTASFLLRSIQPPATGGGQEGPNATFTFNQQTPGIPEPATLATFMLGIAGLTVVGRRRRSAAGSTRAA